MRALLQRVERASVAVGGDTVGAVAAGLLVLLGVGRNDTEQTADKMLAKIARLRIFPDPQGKTNLSVTDIGGEVLVVSQFTLYADCRAGNRPSFAEAGSPRQAEALYGYFVQKAETVFRKTSAGCFGAHMKVTLTNDGPFTVALEIE